MANEYGMKINSNVELEKNGKFKRFLLSISGMEFDKLPKPDG